MFFEEDIRTDIYNTSFESYSVGGFIDEDGKYWYNILMQDLGWRKKVNGNWGSVGSNYTRVKDGYLYINLNKRVAVYISYDGFRAFRVTLNPKSND
jgi:hypothetical protein